MEASVFTPEAVSRKTLQSYPYKRNRKREKLSNFAWLDENVSVPVSWEE